MFRDHEVGADFEYRVYRPETARRGVSESLISAGLMHTISASGQNVRAYVVVKLISSHQVMSGFIRGEDRASMGRLAGP